MDEIITLINNYSLNDRVILDLRYIPNEEVPSIFEIADVVAYPYLSSTQSASIQVAYAFGKPVIASNVGGLPEVVDIGKSGLLVEPNNSEELARAIDLLISDEGLRKDMGRYAKELSQTRFSWDSIAATILQVYETKLV